MTWLAEVVLVATLLEAILLSIWGRRIGAGIGAIDALRMLLPGAALTAALWLALAGRPAASIGAALLVALVAHLADLFCRLRQPGG